MLVEITGFELATLEFVRLTFSWTKGANVVELGRKVI